MTKALDKNITMPKTFWVRLEQLANGNSEGVRGRMLVMLAYLATAMPEEFGIFPPSDNKGSHPEVDRRTTNEGPGERVNIPMLPSDWETVQRLANPNTKGYKSTLLRHLITVAFTDPDKFNLYPPSDVPVYRDGITISRDVVNRHRARNVQLDESVFRDEATDTNQITEDAPA